jgi:hypothetical protein
VVLLAGCGGSARLSRSEFRSKANAVCQRANAQLRQLSSAGSLDEIVASVDQRTRIVSDELRGLRKLKPPKADEVRFDAFLNDLRSRIARLPDLKAAAQGGDRPRARSVLQEIASNPTERDAQALGLSECASTPSLRA